MENPIKELEAKIIELTNIMEDELSALKNGKVISSEILEKKTELTNDIERQKESIEASLSDADSSHFKETLRTFLDVAAVLHYELEKNIVWTNNIISEINNYIEIKLKGVNLYSFNGKTTSKNSSHVMPITLFERI